MENKLKLAEIVGIMLGDGCLYKEKRRNRYQTIICFHKEEKDYLKHVKNLFEEYFRYKFCITEIKHEMLLRNSSFFVGKSLIDSGLSSGNKVDNESIIPSWIFQDKRLIIEVIRGLFDTDGCVYRKYDNYAQIHFKFGCPELTESLHSAIKEMGFNPTRIQKGYNKDKRTYFWKFYLSRQNEIENFFGEIEPKNPKHVIRYEKIKNGDAGI